MFAEELNTVTNASKAKVRLLKGNLGGYFLSSCLAGMYVGFGILLIFTIGGLLDGAPHTKIVMGVSFGIALSLVIAAGSELFTGNNFVMTIGVLKKEVTMGETLHLWVVCLIGNWAGSVVLALLFHYSGLAAGPVEAFIDGAATTKTTLEFWPLFIRAILCNILVCLAVWCSFRLKSDGAKLLMVFWCLFAFITTGFEHSIANMTLLTVSLLSAAETGIAASGYFYNLGVVVLGNMVGAIVFLALPYYIIGREKGKV